MKNTAEGYNVATDKYEDLLSAGVVDPTKVTRSACRMRLPSPVCCLPRNAASPTSPRRRAAVAALEPDMGGMGGMGGMGMM
ncbi:MAG: hypothetical protein ACLT38_00440 [Akkermansia sp.]